MAGSKNHLVPLLNQFDKRNVYLCVFDQGEISKEAEHLGIQVFYLHQKSRYDLSVLGKLKKIIESERIDILHTHGARANVYAYLLKKVTSFSWMTTVHSDPRLDFISCGLKGWVFTKIHLLVLKKVQHFFAISERFKDILVGMGIKPSRITTIYNGVSFDEVSHVNKGFTREKLGLREDHFVMITVGRLHPIKGHQYLLKALKKVIEARPDITAKLLIVGDGILRESLHDLVNELHIKEQVIFLGYQDDVQSLYRLADVEILPSLSESFPLVVLEAAKEKLPVIATDVGGVRELISNKRLGWVIPPQNEELLFHAIIEAVDMYKNAQLKQVGINLYERASKQYSLQQLVKSVIETYLSFEKRMRRGLGH